MSNTIKACGVVWVCLSLTVRADTHDHQQEFADSFRNLQVPESSAQALGRDLSILVIGPYSGQRESVDLAARLGVSDIGSFMTFSRTRFGSEKLVGATYFDQERMVEELAGLLERRWDVIVIGKMSWSAFPKGVQLAILKAVHSGTGLLYVGLSDDDRFTKRIKEEKQVPVPTYISSSVLLDKAFVNAYSDVVDGVMCAQLGQGRICFLDYVQEVKRRSSGGMLTSSREIYSVKPMVDACLSFISRSVLWVSHRVPENAIGSASVSADGDKLTLRIEPQPEEQVSLSARVAIRDEDGTVISDEKADLKRSPTDNTVFESPFPELANGRFFVDVELWEGDTLADRTVVFREAQPHPVRIEVQPEKYSFLPHERIVGQVNVQSPLADLSVKIELSDNLGRLIEKTSVPVVNGQAGFDFGPVAPLVSLHTIRATVLREEDALGDDCASIGLKAEPASDFVSCVWVMSPVNLPGQQSLLRALRMEGVDVIYAYNTAAQSAFIQKSQGEAIARANLLSMPYALRIYFTGSPVNMSRRPCLNDPAYRKQITRIFARQKANFWAYFPYFYSLGDENSLSAYNDADICCSEFCNRDFIVFLKEQFEDLSQLNACWRKDYTSWDEVTPVLLAEARKENYLIPWFYHRMHMDRVYTDIHEFCKQQVRAFDPNGKVGVEGGLYGSTWGGGDHSQLDNVLDFLVPYESWMRDEMLSSYVSDKSYGSICGSYAPRMSNLSRNRFTPWKVCFSGGNMCVWWLAGRIIPHLGLITGAGMRPDHEPYTWFRAYCDAVREIKNGPATLIRHSAAVRSGVAILYSRLACYSATAGASKSHLNSFVKLVNDMGHRPEVLTFESIRDPSFSHETYPVLILSGCAYLPRDIADRIGDYMAAGGRVICDVYPRLDMQGMGLSMDHSRMMVFNPDKLSRYHRDSGCSPLATFAWTSEGAKIRADFRGVMDGVALRPSVEVSRASGEAAFNCYVVEYENGSERYLGILRYPFCADGETPDVHIKLRKKTFVYDVRAETLVGLTNAMNIALQPGDAKLFALSPRQHPDFRLSMAQGSSVLSIAPVEAFPGKLFFRVEVVAPNGTPVPHYSGNTVLEGTTGDYGIQHALNDVAGEWTVTVTDIVTGNSKVLTYVRER